MKRALIILFLFTEITCFSQNAEFDNSDNGLIYSALTVKQLKHIVDSLNLKFKVCELNKTYFSKFQAKAHFISLESRNVKEAKNDIEANIPFDDFIKKYTTAKIERELLVVRFNYKDYQEKEVIEYSTIALSDKYEHEFTFEKNTGNFNQPLKGKWIYKYYDKTSYSKESVDAFYFTEEFSQQAIPEACARMIQYSDCMVDTSAKVFHDKAHRSGRRYRNDEPSASKKFRDYIDMSTYKPEYITTNNEKEEEIYWKKYQLWDSLKFSRMDSLKLKDEKFNILLNEAVKEAINNGGTNDEFEEYVGLYYSKKTELELKRNRRVIGGCSQDDSPRIHALNIAKLSAETVNWEIFLRSHLDIMNDRFERASDGSYAWGRRKTYIKELEVLDINVLDLLLGITFRIENANTNHYYGSIGRLGRALAETNKNSELEAKMLQLISNKQLDDYNRIMIYYLFLNYNYNLENKQQQAENNKKLIAAVNTLPEYLAKKITIEK